MLMTPVESRPNPEVKIKVKEGEPRPALGVIDMCNKYAEVLPMKELNSECVLSA